MPDVAPPPRALAFPATLASVIDPRVVALSEQTVTIAEVVSRNGRETATSVALEAALGVKPPQGPGFVASAAMSLIGIGPSRWLCCKNGEDMTWAAQLAQALAGQAAVVDQSGYAVVELSGPGARTLLSRGVFIDLDPSVFGPGSAAVSWIARLDVVLWQVDAAPSFRVAVHRSHADAFVDWIRDVAAAGDLA